MFDKRVEQQGNQSIRLTPGKIGNGDGVLGHLAVGTGLSTP